ncbi:MAG: hypothetical protein AB1668_05175 [Nanoarchaeota archaeon]
MENKKLEILVVEDNEKHLADAKGIFEKYGEHINVIYATNLRDAGAALAAAKLDGVISDVFFSYDGPSWNREVADKCSEALKQQLNRLREYWEYRTVALKWQVHGTGLPPAGVLVAEEAMKQNIPVVLCTSTYHHSLATEPINHYARDKKIELVDVYTGERDFNNEWTEGESKDWGRALASLVLSVELERNRERIRRDYKPSEDWRKDDPRDKLIQPILEQLSEKYKGIFSPDDLKRLALKYTHPVWEGLR